MEEMRIDRHPFISLLLISNSTLNHIISAVSST